MEIAKSKVLIQFLLIFKQSGDVLLFLHARRLPGYTATTTVDYPYGRNRIYIKLTDKILFHEIVLIVVYRTLWPSKSVSKTSTFLGENINKSLIPYLAMV